MDLQRKFKATTCGRVDGLKMAEKEELSMLEELAKNISDSSEEDSEDDSDKHEVAGVAKNISDSSEEDSEGDSDKHGVA